MSMNSLAASLPIDGRQSPTALAVARGTTLLVITHDLGFAAETLDRALVLDAGRLARDEPLHQLVATPGRLAPLGLAPPPLVELSLALALPGTPVRIAAVVGALAARCREL